MTYHFDIDCANRKRDIEQTKYKIVPIIISDYLVEDTELKCFVLVQL